MLRLAGEGVPISAIARCMNVPRTEVHEAIMVAVRGARLLAPPPADWPPGQPSSQRRGRAIRYDDIELTVALQRRFQITRQQTLLLLVMLKRSLATKEALHAAAQQVHGPEYETSQKLVDVLICKLRRRMKRHGFMIGTIWGAGYSLPIGHRKGILRAIGLALPDLDPQAQPPVKVPVRSTPRR